ncbi:MBL fold metallo-hydrolase [Nocardia crassostreae]|uniref:MBL fold metallo-hydrolase n=1 Tax=Nocardia crassostreae TaxID=53428 RepID=UPI0008329C52|nr:MBL fold metallo-hydrolase [Nocardia crassostreae]
MQLTVLGCRAGMPADGQPSSGYLVDTGASRILLDCGPGIATALTADRSPAVLDAVIISHLHIDHCYDLLPLGKALLAPFALAKYPGFENWFADTPDRLPQIPLYVPAGARPILDTLASALTTETLPVLDRVFEAAFDVREYRPDETVAIGEHTCEFIALPHAKPNCGMRICGPSGSMACTGDTGVSVALERLAADVDLFLAEASLERTDRGAHGHLCAADAARAAAAAGAHELLLTHLPTSDEVWLKARLAEATQLFPGRVRLAHPGLVCDVGS